uniref:Uncharacterized protein n=1 Tax=Candidatus Kentrum sp. FM TaxID=2126340 RepID=A0A450SEV5_9GAMM|nr:MAG: hypothetical protein BECKFM1743A_GA0114220_100918 [Candidatus Kentron sp. FM]VFJ51275.1 MAG: hypothetical protein BECKFM1743C_GA0114222_100958 [Candidatus Kentron sp. FM]VFK08872.1 MAG: hypothetical protein BECKFM1743B_GA0114221_100847 [Candidatus Kentron sp. FM]
MDGAGDTPYPFGPCLGTQLYSAYTRWCRANGIRFPCNAIQFLNRVGKMPGWLCGNDARFRIWDNTRYTGPKTNPLRFVVPDQTQLALNKCGRPPGKDSIEWLIGVMFFGVFLDHDIELPCHNDFFNPR